MKTEKQEASEKHDQPEKADAIIRQLEALIRAEKARLAEKHLPKAHTTEPAADKQESTKPVHTETHLPAEEAAAQPSFWDFILDILKAPFLFFGKYLRRELTEAIRNDFRRIALIALLSFFVFAMIIGFWLSIQVAVYLYLVSVGLTPFLAVLASVGIQLLSLLAVLGIMYNKATNMDTARIIKRLKD